uniref:(northern house mosquito) hypothetical protein n=1 Tax=Culex pipiens TaxID=7175 RepID=A0A8D8L478_CULPI
MGWHARFGPLDCDGHAGHATSDRSERKHQRAPHSGGRPPPADPGGDRAVPGQYPQSDRTDLWRKFAPGAHLPGLVRGKDVPVRHVARQSGTDIGSIWASAGLSLVDNVLDLLCRHSGRRRGRGRTEAREEGVSRVCVRLRRRESLSEKSIPDFGERWSFENLCVETFWTNFV